MMTKYRLMGTLCINMSLQNSTYNIKHLVFNTFLELMNTKGCMMSELKTNIFSFNNIKRLRRLD